MTQRVSDERETKISEIQRHIDCAETAIEKVSLLEQLTRYLRADRDDDRAEIERLKAKLVLFDAICAESVKRRMRIEELESQYEAH